MFVLTSAYAQPSFTLGVGLNKGVFAAEGKEDNFDESGSLKLQQLNMELLKTHMHQFTLRWVMK